MKKKEIGLFVQAMMVLSLLPISTIYGEEPDTAENKTFRFTVLKTNESDDKIKGAYLRVFDESNNLVEEWTTEEGSHMMSRCHLELIFFMKNPHRKDI